MTDLDPATIAIITTIGSLIVPPVASLLKRENWATQWKQLIAGVLSLGIAALGLWIVQPTDFALPLLTLGGLVYAGSQVIYGGFFKGSVVESTLAKVGSKPATTEVTP